MQSFLVLVISTVVSFLVVSLPSTSHAVIRNSIDYGLQVNELINDEHIWKI